MLLEQKSETCSLTLGLGGGRSLNDGKDTVWRQKFDEEIAVIRS